LIFDDADKWEELQGDSEDEVLKKVKAKIEEQLSPL
jgi:hypothetical protein